jgi:hypothetical protein
MYSRMLVFCHGVWWCDSVAWSLPWSPNHGQHSVVTVASKNRLEEATKAPPLGEVCCISSSAVESSKEDTHQQSISVMPFAVSLESTTVMICQYRAPTVAFSDVRIEGIM